MFVKTEMWRTFLALKRKKELNIPFPAVVVAIFAAFTAYNGFCIADRSDELQKWYDENHEAILFGRYLRVHENQRWNYWHKEWGNDPSLEKDMYDYYMFEEPRSDKEKK